MSRCFPYPPPGYTLSREKHEALVELIKLQEEREKMKEKRREKKQRRMEKKEKRKLRKERSKEKKDKTSQKVDKSDIATSHERIDAETEQFEQSGLTEEHGHPDSVPVPSSSCDSTENSNKRKRHFSPAEGSHGHGKLKDDSGPRDSPENFCYTSGRTSSIDQREQICSTSVLVEAVAPGKSGNRSPLNEVVRGLELQYKTLLENWFPPQLHDASHFPVEADWLYPDRRNHDVRAEKRQRSGSDSMSCSRSSAWWPRAEYLHEIDAFALPYVVPY